MDAIIRFLQDTGFYLFSQDGNWRCLIMLGIACVLLSLALFPQVAPKFLAWRDGPHEAPAQPAEAPKAPPADPNAVRELFVEYKF